MDQKQDYKEKYEKGKLHARYLFIIAGILAIIGISIVLGGSSEALGQISMASTLSSIILSSIAIFMSISGENKLNYTHDKLVETSDRMSDITADIEKANSKLDNTINQKFMKIDDIFDRLERIGQSVDNVEKEVLNSLRVNENSTVSVSSDILWQAYDNMVKAQGTTFERAIKAAIEYTIVCLAENAGFEVENMVKYVKSVIGTSDIGSLDEYYEGYALGVVRVFVNIGITKIETIKYFKQKMDLPQEKRDEIRKFF